MTKKKLPNEATRNTAGVAGSGRIIKNVVCYAKEIAVYNEIQIPPKDFQMRHVINRFIHFGKNTLFLGNEE